MKVFLSYTLDDQAHARRIADHLAQAGMEVWDAEREILPGDDFGEEISRALGSSDAMIVLLSPAATRSRAVRREIEFALQSPSYAHRLIPVLVQETDSVPWILQKLQMVDLQREPVAGLDQIVQVLRSPEAA